jgi:hypothetical protein
VAGSYAVVGAVDILVELRRVPGAPAERTLEVIGCYGCWNRKGRLVDERYEWVDAPATGETRPVQRSESSDRALHEGAGDIANADRELKQLLLELEQAEPAKPSQREIARRLGLPLATYQRRVKQANAGYHRAMKSAEWKRCCQAIRER